MSKKLLTVLMFFSMTSCSPALHAQEESNKESCIKSVEKYMDKEEAERFCRQPADCRKWWDDLSEEEKQEMQPPVWKKDPDWMIKCEQDHK